MKLDEMVKTRWFKTVFGLLFVTMMMLMFGSIAVTHQKMTSALPAEMRQALSLTFVFSIAAGLALNQAFSYFLDLFEVWFKPEEDKIETAPAGGDA